MAHRDLLAAHARSAESIAQDLARFDERVEEFSRHLEDVVRRALTEEADSVSSEWIDEAKIVLEGLAEDPGRLRNLDADLDSLREGLATTIGVGALKPTAEEITAETREVARTALDEWMTRLARASSEAPRKRKFFLNADALPGDESLAELLRGVEVHGVSAETVSATLLAFFRDVLIRESRFAVSDDLYIVENRASHDGYLLAVEGALVEAAPFERRVETVMSDFILEEELCQAQFLPRLPAEVTEEVASAVQGARRVLGAKKIELEPLTKLTFACVALAGAVISHRAIVDRMCRATTGRPQELDKRAIRRFTEHLVIVTGVDRPVAAKAVGIVAGAATDAFEKSSGNDTGGGLAKATMHAVYSTLREKIPSGAR